MNILYDIRVIIGWCREIIRTGFRNKKILKSCENYLVNGIYKNSYRGDYIYNVSNNSDLGNITFSSLTFYKGHLKFVLKWLINLFEYKINNEKKTFCGTEVIISSTETEIKIFDTTKDEVLTLYKELHKLNNIAQEKEFFSLYYNVPSTIMIDHNNKYICERFVRHKEFVVKEAFDKLCKSMVDYVQANGNDAYCNIEDDKIKSRFFEECFGKSLLLDLTLGFPKIKMHGDFWRSNIIFDGSCYYVTDFEKAGSRYFLYDFFCFIFSDCRFFKNEELMDSYFNGEYDSVLISMFESVKQKYDSSKRDVYFLTFIVELSYERLSKFHTLRIMGSFLKKYIPCYFKI